MKYAGLPMAMWAAGASSSGSTRWHPAGRTATADTIKNKSRPKAAEKCFVQIARDGVLDHDGHGLRRDGHDLAGHRAERQRSSPNRTWGSWGW